MEYGIRVRRRPSTSDNFSSRCPAAEAARSVLEAIPCFHGRGLHNRDWNSGHTVAHAVEHPPGWCRVGKPDRTGRQATWSGPLKFIYKAKWPDMGVPAD